MTGPCPVGRNGVDADRRKTARMSTFGKNLLGAVLKNGAAITNTEASDRVGRVMGWKVLEIVARTPLNSSGRRLHVALESSHGTSAKNG